MTTDLRPVGRRRLLHEGVQDELKRYIIENNLRPGAALPSEGELAERLGVGRNSVREAVKALEALGIIEVKVGSGLFVRAFSLDPLLDNLTDLMLADVELLAEIREARRFLEVGMIENVIGAVDGAQLAHLRSILREWREVAGERGYSPDHDRAFHHAVRENIDNGFVSGILERFWEAQRRSLERGIDPGPPDPVAHVRLHAAIYDAIRRKDATGMRTAIDRHYFAILDRLGVSDTLPPKPRAGSGKAARALGADIRPNMG
jgi:DNA-binding FadR family transcriptional regulator